MMVVRSERWQVRIGMDGPMLVDPRLDLDPLVPERLLDVVVEVVAGWVLP
jgi:hypothetical protein